MHKVDSLRTQAQLHAHIAIRDLPKRFVTVQFLLVAIWQTEQAWVALATLGALIGLESATYCLTRHLPPVQDLSRRRLAASLGLSTLVSACYYIPGVVLALSPDFALAIGGLAWILAALSTNLVMYNALRAFYVTTAVVGYPAALIAIAGMTRTEIAPAGEYSFLLPISIVFLFIANTVQQLRDYRDTHIELERTRVELLHNLRKVEHMSLHDGLTGLANRAAFHSRLNKMISRAAPDRPLGVFVIDLNGFKSINDTYGHGAGDAILTAVASRLTETLRPEAQGFRLGGDEFAVLSFGTDTADFQAMGDRLAEVMRQPVPHDGETLFLSASFGVGVATKPEPDAEKVIAVADHAMFLAKSKKLQTALIGDAEAFEGSLNPQRHADLAAALRHQKIIPYYQPKFTADGRRLVGLQALARWIAPDGSVLAPPDFLSDLDDAGLLPELTLSMLRAVLQDLTQWQARGMEVGRVSINVPAVSLATLSRREEINWLVAEFPGLESALAFEITEDFYTDRGGDLVEASLRHFADQGIAVLLDDFGTAYASYRHLQLFTPDEIKIDGGLIANIAPGAPALAVIEGFIRIGHGLGAMVVAENVETEAQRQHLAAIGCDYIEGRLFAPALPRAALDDFLRTRALNAG